MAVLFSRALPWWGALWMSWLLAGSTCVGCPGAAPQIMDSVPKMKGIITPKGSGAAQQPMSK